jgi:adenosylcobinamide kinase/adenosylcobinamide-phosphate guanylyltransferase
MPSKVYLVTGGCRSGKSGYAEKLCESLCKEPIYLATSSKNWDDDFNERIKRHQADRGAHWTTVEEPLTPSTHVTDKFLGKVVMVDCLTLWLTNYMVQEGAFEMPKNAGKDGEQATTGTDNKAPERALELVKEEFNKLTEAWNVTYIFVTNEVGSGTHAPDNMSRKFIDVQGWFNQYVASKAERVIHMVCGVPNAIKEPTNVDPRSPLILPTKQQIDEASMLDKTLSARGIAMEAKGYWIIKVDRSKTAIVAEFYSCIVNDKGEVCDLEGKKIKCCGDGKKERPAPMKVFEARTAKELQVEIFERWTDVKDVMSMLEHACYIGREAQRAEHCLYAGEYYQQN